MVMPVGAAVYYLDHIVRQESNGASGNPYTLGGAFSIRSRRRRAAAARVPMRNFSTLYYLLYIRFPFDPIPYPFT